jgi:hypothetical protein
MTGSRKPARSARHLPIAGFALKANKFDGIYLGRRKGKDLIYAGKVDNGLDISSTAELQARLTLLIRETQPYAKKISHRGAERKRKRPSASGGAPSVQEPWRRLPVIRETGFLKSSNPAREFD